MGARLMKTKTAVGWTGLLAIPVFFLLVWVITQGVIWQREPGDLAKLILFLHCFGTVLLTLLLCFCVAQACRWVAWDDHPREQSLDAAVFRATPDTIPGTTIELEPGVKSQWALMTWRRPLSWDEQERVLGLLGEARCRLDAANCNGRLVGRDHELADRIDTELALLANSRGQTDEERPPRNDDRPTGEPAADAVSQGNACALPGGNDVPEPGRGHKR